MDDDAHAAAPSTTPLPFPPPLRARAYDPTLDEPLPSAAASDTTENKTQIEFVDVYLLAPEDDNRPIELKDFTIMKPKNNKMHRLVRYFPRCEISYTAAPPPPPVEDKLVTSPHGTTTTVVAAAPLHRHNGGFSNPSRNAAVFRLKRTLLSDYNAQLDTGAHDATWSAAAAAAAALAARATSKRPTSPMDAYLMKPHFAPTYQPPPFDDADSVALSSHQVPRLSLKERLQYIDALWPQAPPEAIQSDDDDALSAFYGVDVTIISDEERAREVRLAATVAATDTAAPERERASDEMEDLNADADAAEVGGETFVPMTNPVASKQDDWVQCDKCQQWRRLPNYVNVSELPATWYCKMNRWDKRFNKCTVPEEKTVVMVKESDLFAFRERKFTRDFLHRIKRLEKALVQHKCAPTDTSTALSDNNPNVRLFVECVECHKQRPLIKGMDPQKVQQPFVCWMNWDELHASCSARQGALLLPFDCDLETSERQETSEKSGKKSTGHDVAARKAVKSALAAASAANSHVAYSHAKRKAGSLSSMNHHRSSQQATEKTTTPKKPRRR